MRTQVIEVDGSAEYPDCCAIDCGEEADLRLTRARGLFKRPYQLFACLDHADVARNALVMDVPPICEPTRPREGGGFHMATDLVYLPEPLMRSVRVGEGRPRQVVALTGVHVARAQGNNPLGLGVLVVRCEIDVQPVLDGLRLAHGPETESRTGGFVRADGISSSHSTSTYQSRT